MDPIPCLFFYLPEASISEEHVSIVEAQIKQATQNEMLYLVIDSYGGDPLAAVRIIRILQEKFKKISVIIPNCAMSAATLMTLGSDEIYMKSGSVLGPLDLQVEHPKDGSIVSVLDLRNLIFTLDTLKEEFVMNNFNILRRLRFNRPDAVKSAFEYANEFLKPILAQVDPFHLQKSFREVDLALKYGVSLLSSRMMLGDEKKAYETLRHLIEKYPAHGYGISSKEAQDDLNLVVKDLDLLSEWEQIKIRYNTLAEQKLNYAILYLEITEKNENEEQTAN